MGLLSINKLFQNRFNLNFALQFAIKKNFVFGFKF